MGGRDGLDTARKISSSFRDLMRVPQQVHLNCKENTFLLLSVFVSTSNGKEWFPHVSGTARKEVLRVVIESGMLVW
jgi:hypothetical protein